MKDARFQEVTGLNMELGVETLDEGGINSYSHRLPGRGKFENLVLKRGLLLDTELKHWIIEMIRQGVIDTNKIRFYIGYSGWSDGQLSDELNEKTWMMAQAKYNLVFHENDSEIWKDSIKLLGGDYEIMVNFPIDPQLN